MNRSIASYVHMTRRLWPAGIAIILIAVGGCSDDDDTPTGPGPGPTSTTMTGFMANSAENGGVTINIATTTLAPAPGATAARRVAVDATASFTPLGGGVVNMTGTFDEPTDSLYLSGGGYSIAAQIDNSGDPPNTFAEYNGPNGPGFLGAVDENGNGLIMSFCGTFQSDTVGLDDGNLSFIISNDQLGGAMFSSNTALEVSLEGDVAGTGSARTLSATAVNPGVDSVAVVGTANTMDGVASGTWTRVDLNTQAAVTGIWTAVECP